mmetsp:Transcript_12487/g.29357  ORF Transcript_12487/g.29357 Transcript_12487/m.29357 type:complete len:271 (+) Transcript_12487:161-973(+)
MPAACFRGCSGGRASAPSIGGGGLPFEVLVREYDYWRARYVVDFDDGTSAVRRFWPLNSNDIVSEGVAYGMLIAACVEDFGTFHRLWRFAFKHQNTKSGLMRWHINIDGEEVYDDEGEGAATDADLDIAFALILCAAKRRSLPPLAPDSATHGGGGGGDDPYHACLNARHSDTRAPLKVSEGVPNYFGRDLSNYVGRACEILDAVYSCCVDADTHILTPGDMWSSQDHRTSCCNPSYMAVAYFAVFAQIEESDRSVAEHKRPNRTHCNPS